MKYLFLDTNIFLHFKSYNDIPWIDIIGQHKYTIVIAMLVIDELDKQKNSTNRKIAKKAKSTISKIEEIIDEKVINGINVRILNSRPNDSVFSKYSLSKTHQDDCLLASILTYELQEGDESIFITNDSGAKIRAKMHNIHCIKMPEEYMLEPELDEDEKMLKGLQKELDELKIRQPKVSLAFKNSEKQLKCTSVKMQFTKEEYIKNESLRNRRNYGHLRKNEERTDINRFVFNPFNQISDTQIDEYNQDLDKFHLEYEQHLEEEYSYKVYLSSCLEIELSLSNTGTLPAEDIDVHLHFPDGFELVEELEKVPKKPTPPRKPKSIMNYEPLSIFPTFERYAIPVLKQGPQLTRLEKTNSYNVEFKIKNLKHNQNISLPKLYACFETLEAMKNFHLDYSLMISNVPRKVDGVLHVIFNNT